MEDDIVIEEISVAFAVARRDNGKWIAFRSTEPLFCVEADSASTVCELAAQAIKGYKELLIDREEQRKGR